MIVLGVTMEQSSFVEAEEHSVFHPSQFNQGHDLDREQQEEYEDEQRNIEERVILQNSLFIHLLWNQFVKPEKHIIP